MNLAIALDRLGEHDRARHYYKRFLKLASYSDPDRDAVRNRLEQLGDRAQIQPLKEENHHEQ